MYERLNTTATQTLTENEFITTPFTELPTAFRPKRPKPFYARTTGARKGRMEKPENLFEDLIKLGKVKVIRRRGKPPLIQFVKADV